MGKKDNRFIKKCTVCGKNYEYCATCSRFSHLPRWMDAYCSENCKELYNITAGFINNWKTPEIEAARLKERDLSYIDKLPQWMQDAIKEIQAIDTTNADAINAALADTKPDEVSDKQNLATETTAEEVVEKVLEHLYEPPMEEHPVFIKPDELDLTNKQVSNIKVAQPSTPGAVMGDKVSKEFKEATKTIKRHKPKISNDGNK